MLDFILYADDTNVFISIKILIVCVRVELDKLSAWFSLSKLPLNISETNYDFYKL